MSAVKAHFRPEFLNRLDEIVLFHPLSQHNIRDIVRIQFDKIVSRVSARGIKIKIDDDALDLISSSGYDAVYGARPLRRYIEKHVITPVSRLILGGKIGGGVLITTKFDDEGENVLNFENVESESEMLVDSPPMTSAHPLKKQKVVKSS
jgi:ATP-dependent Clp protease ATP-binding subunit ClpB